MKEGEEDDSVFYLARTESTVVVYIRHSGWLEGHVCNAAVPRKALDRRQTQSSTLLLSALLGTANFVTTSLISLKSVLYGKCAQSLK